LEEARLDAERRQSMADEMKWKPPTEDELERLREIKRKEEEEKEKRRIEE
jgi:hypothetical protein